MPPPTQRIGWTAVPPSVRVAVEDVAGSRIEAAANISSGFSLGLAARCSLADGRAVFVKACSGDINVLMPGLLRQESNVLAALPIEYPSPRLLGTVEREGWVALVIEHIGGYTPEPPLAAGDVEIMLELATRLADLGTPSPIDWLPELGIDEIRRGSRWAWRRAAEEGLDSRLDGWSRRHLTTLIDLESGWVDAARGTTLLHGDFRPDNVVITPSGPVAVDWPAAGIGAEWVDLVGLLPALHLAGGADPAAMFGSHPLSRRADPDRVDRYLAALAGYFTRQSLLPQPAGVRPVREFQAAQGEICRRWLAARRGLH